VQQAVESASVEHQAGEVHERLTHQSPQQADLLRRIAQVRQETEVQIALTREMLCTVRRP
jgi:hypothetical protein